MAEILTVNDVLDGHVVLHWSVHGPDLSERLRAEPSGGWSGGVVHDSAPGLPDSLAGDHGEWIGTRFRRSIKAFAEADRVPVVRFGKGDRKLEVMRPHIATQPGTRRCVGS